MFLYVSNTAPSAPTNITLEEVGSTYVVVSWGVPDFPNGIIRQYIVSLTDENGVLLSNISTSALSVNISQLAPFTHYQVTVVAETVDIGQDTADISFMTQESSEYEIFVQDSS